MLGRTRLILSLAALGLSSLAGCGVFQCGCGDGCRTKSPYAGMKYDVCCETCGPNCGPSSGRGGCATCCQAGGRGCGEEVGCGSPGDDGGAGRCKSCGASNCRKCWFFGMFDCAGCGGTYWNEWYNDPPDRCEPCDCHGNYTGSGMAGYYQSSYLHQSEYAAPVLPPVPPLEEAPLLDEAPPVPDPQIDGELDKLGVDNLGVEAE